jgi:hypothetical protein
MAMRGHVYILDVLGIIANEPERPGKERNWMLGRDRKEGERGVIYHHHVSRSPKEILEFFTDE